MELGPHRLRRGQDTNLRALDLNLHINMTGPVVTPARALSPLQSLVARRWRPQWVCKHRQQHQLRALATPASTIHSHEDAKPFYATTPIFYVNAAPHVGHMYTMVLTDVLKRWEVLRGRRAILCTGTDEHGMKIQQAAAKAKVQPKEFCDDGAQVFKDLAGLMNMSNDIFIRTTDKKHREAVEYAWIVLQEKGWIYEGKHEGWYSVSDETFVPAGQVHLIVDPPTGRRMMVSIETGKEVEWTSERNYHFRLSAFRDRLLEFYKANPEFVVPRMRMNHIVQQVTAGLEDLSVSRPAERLEWGVPVPTDSSQTIYVWLDALLNYASAAGYPFTPGSEAAKGWPPNVHVVGKDIIRFHCVYWPAFLMALDLPLPKQVLTHAHWTIGRKKMAKSTGNVVNPFFAVERFGTDVMRWYLVHEGALEDDPEYDNGLIADRYRKSLKGGLGNLASRILRGSGWNLANAVKDCAGGSEEAKEGLLSSNSKNASHIQAFYDRLRTLHTQVDGHMRALRPNMALRSIMGSVADANAFLQQCEPWTLAALAREPGTSTKPTSELQTTKDLEMEIARVIFLNGETLRLVGIMLQAFIPNKAAELLDMLGVKPERRSMQWCRLGMDTEYGTPKKGTEGNMLFPKLMTPD